MKTFIQKVTPLVLGALVLSASLSADAKPNGRYDREDKREVKDARRDVKEAKRDLKRERKEARTDNDRTDRDRYDNGRYDNGRYDDAERRDFRNRVNRARNRNNTGNNTYNRPNVGNRPIYTRPGATAGGYVGVVTTVRSSQSFDARINGQVFNVYLTGVAPRGLSVGDTVRVSGVRQYSNDIRQARVSVLRQG